MQDLAQGHVVALQCLQGQGESLTVTLGTGRGCSVLDVVNAFESASGKHVPYKIAPAVRVTWPSATLTQHWPSGCWGGVPDTRWLTSALTPGAGKATTRGVTRRFL